MNDLQLADLGKQLFAQSELAIKGILDGPQVPCPLRHHFGPGTYLREAFYPAGSLIIGHVHKQDHINIFVQGRLKMLDADGTVTEMVAPMTFVGKPGRKFAYMMEDVIWQNVWATDLTDIDDIEEWAYDFPEFWRQHQLLEDKTQAAESTLPLMPMPRNCNKVINRRTPSGQRGLFATHPVGAGEVLAPAAACAPRRSAAPNAVIIDGMIIATEPLVGCVGGSIGTEVTIQMEDELCQQQ